VSKKKMFTVILEILNAEFIFYTYNNGKVRESVLHISMTKEIHYDK